MITYKIEQYVGRKIGSGYMERVGMQIVATDSATGKRKAVFSTGKGKSPCYKIPCGARHYRTGCSAEVKATLADARIKLENHMAELLKGE